MVKQNVLLAKLEQGAGIFRAMLRDYALFFKKNASDFRGVKNTYTPKPDTVDLPNERAYTPVVTTVDEKVKYLETSSKEYINDMFTCEATNASGAARADLIVDGKVIANLSSLELLKLKSFLENPQLMEMYNAIPVRSNAEIWDATKAEEYTGRAIFESPILEGLKKSITKEQYILEDPNLSKMKDASSYKPQIAVKDTVMELGDYTMQKFTGEWSTRQRAEVLSRRNKLVTAVVTALKVANEAEVVTSEMTADKLFGYLHEGKL